MTAEQKETINFQLRYWNRLLFTTALLRHRHFDGHILSMQQSGTHWMRYMLGLCMAEVYRQPPPASIQSEVFIGNPRQPPSAAAWPCLVSSHSLPHALMYSRTFCRGFHFPRYLLLVRDIRYALVSHYEKWRDKYRVDFPTYLRGDPWGRLDNLWRCIELQNAYGCLAAAGAVETRILRYEDTLCDPVRALATACDFFRVPATPDIIARAVTASTKEEMAQHSNPCGPGEKVVRLDSRHPFTWYTAEDRAFFQRVCRRHLRHSFGYHYDEWSRDAAAGSPELSGPSA